MTIWLLAFVLLALFGALGYFKGAVRMVVPLVGLGVGLLLALPLAPLVRPLVPMVGMTNPIWSILVPPVVVFFLIELVFVGLGFLLHHRISVHFRNTSDDYQRTKWERLNQRLGVSMGLAAGAFYTLVIGIVVYVLGYLTVQISAEANDPAPVRYLNKARQDLRESGLENIVAAFDFAPPRYYEASDVMGFLYHNPLVYSRLASYPPVLVLAERPEFAEIANDAEFLNMLASQPSVATIINHPKTQGLVGNPGVLEPLDQLDLKDLIQYLKTGISPKYQDQPILGRWEVDTYNTFQQAKRQKVGMSTADLRALKLIMEANKGFMLVVAPDGTLKLKGPDLGQVGKKLQETLAALAEGKLAKATTNRPVAAVAVAQPAATQASGQPSSRMMQRYGLRPGSPNSGTPPVAAARPAATAAAAAAPAAPQPLTPAALTAEIAKLPTVVLAQGTWKEEAGGYKMQLKSDKDLKQFVGTHGNSSVEAFIRDNRLWLTEDGQTLVLARF
jgi:hypothetical protein